MNKTTDNKKQKTRAASGTSDVESRKNGASAEISAETVVREEVFSSEQRANKRKKSCGCGKCGCPSEPKDEKIGNAAKSVGNKKVKAVISKNGNRPTQKKARMITKDDACDCGKS